MRIAYVFDPLLPSRDTDTEQALRTIGGLAQNGAEMTLVLPRSWRKPGVTIEALRQYYAVSAPFELLHLRSAYPSWRPLEKLAHATRAAWDKRLRHFDVVYTRNLPVVLSCLGSGHRVVYETYRPWPDELALSAPLFRWVTRRANFLGAIFHSNYTRQRYLAAGLAAQCCEVIHNGYDPALLQPRMPKARAREILKLPKDESIVVYSGRITPKKGLHLVLDMAEWHPRSLFLLVGSEGNGPIEQRASKLANVRVVPWVTPSELAPYLYAADVLLIPPTLGPLREARNTVLPMKLFLYLGAGQCIMAPRAPDTAELLQHQRNAWLVDPDDSDVAASALGTLLSDAPLRTSLGRCAKQDAVGFTWKARGHRILDFLEPRLQGRRER